MMEEESLKVLDVTGGQANIYQLVVSLAQRCHELNRMRLGGQRFNVVEEAFREEVARHVEPEAGKEDPAAADTAPAGDDAAPAA